MKKSTQYASLFLIVLMLLFTVSCDTVKYASTQIQTLNPPVRLINMPDTTNIAIVASIHNGIINDSSRTQDSVLIANMAMKIKENLEESPKYNYYIFPVYTIDAKLSEYKLTDTQILDIKEHSNANFLISVEQFDAKISNKKGHEVKEGRLNEFMHVVVEYDLMVRIYNTDNNAIIDERILKDTLAFQVDISPWETEQEIKNKIPTKRTTLLLVSNELAKFYVNEIVPFWKEEIRYYYTEPKLGRAQVYIDRQEWAKAMDVWSKYVDDADPTVAALASFNMALGCEMLGEFELAIEWMENVERKDKKYYSAAYYNLIKQRISDTNVIGKTMQ